MPAPLDDIMVRHSNVLSRRAYKISREDLGLDEAFSELFRAGHCTKQ